MISSQTLQKAHRPYSLYEITYRLTKFIDYNRLSFPISHIGCEHVYRPRRQSVKELLGLSDNPIDANCSVCYMLDQNPRTIIAVNEEPKSFRQLEEFVEFYTWLYKHIV